jgi:hypothetical protein
MLKELEGVATCIRSIHPRRVSCCITCWMFERRDGAPRQAVQVGWTTWPCPAIPARPTSPRHQQRAVRATGRARLGAPDLADRQTDLLEAVALEPTRPTLARSAPVLAEHRRRLRDLLLADRFGPICQRPGKADWRGGRATLPEQLKANLSPAPFSLSDEDWNRDLLTALVNLPDAAAREEIPYRVFSVRIFNDSKRFDALKDSIARLARRHQPAWRDLSSQEILRELGLVANPGHLYLYGPWQLTDAMAR